jgi:hypothetical protein
MMRSKTALEVTRQRITVLQDALLMLRQTQSPSHDAQIARNFLYEMKQMEDEVHEYLQHLPAPEPAALA